MATAHRIKDFEDSTFDPAATFEAFPGFKYTSLDSGLARAQKQEFG